MPRQKQQLHGVKVAASSRRPQQPRQPTRQAPQRLGSPTDQGEGLPLPLLSQQQQLQPPAILTGPSTTHPRGASTAEHSPTRHQLMRGQMRCVVVAPSSWSHTSPERVRQSADLLCTLFIEEPQTAERCQGLDATAQKHFRKFFPDPESPLMNRPNVFPHLLLVSQAC